MSSRYNFKFLLPALIGPLCLTSPIRNYIRAHKHYSSNYYNTTSVVAITELMSMDRWTLSKVYDPPQEPLMDSAFYAIAGEQLELFPNTEYSYLAKYRPDNNVDSVMKARDTTSKTLPVVPEVNIVAKRLRHK